jgi:hypothetical protein
VLCKLIYYFIISFVAVVFQKLDESNLPDDIEDPKAYR